MEFNKGNNMNDNSKKLDELEFKMNVIERALNEIKSAIKERKTECDASDNAKSSIKERESHLSSIEIAKVKNIMKNFNFEKVHNLMKILGWKWVFAKDGIPSVEELKDEAYRILITACEEETHISTGGFKAVYETDNIEDEPYIGLEFIVEECEGFEEDDDDDPWA